MDQNVNYDAKAIFGHENENSFEYSYAIICPEMYVDSFRNYYWRHRDIDLIEENLGIFFSLWQFDSY